MAQWYSDRVWSERSGIRNLPLLEQDILLPESTGSAQEAVAPSGMTEKLLTGMLSLNTNKTNTHNTLVNTDMRSDFTSS